MSKLRLKLLPIVNNYVIKACQSGLEMVILNFELEHGLEVGSIFYKITTSHFLESEMTKIKFVKKYKQRHKFLFVRSILNIICNYFIFHH